LDTNHFRVVAEGGIGAAKIADRAVIEGVEISLTISSQCRKRAADGSD
jgi:hypothetical protein